jgi:hypothetical protein
LLLNKPIHLSITCALYSGCELIMWEAIIGEAIFSFNIDAVYASLFSLQQASALVQADLSGRDFAGERGLAVIVSSQATHRELTESERAAAEARNAEAMRIPRRPHWSHDMPASEVQARERASFLELRRRLARYGS